MASENALISQLIDLENIRAFSNQFEVTMSGADSSFVFKASKISLGSYKLTADRIVSIQKTLIKKASIPESATITIKEDYNWSSFKFLWGWFTENYYDPVTRVFISGAKEKLKDVTIKCFRAPYRIGAADQAVGLTIKLTNALLVGEIKLPSFSHADPSAIEHTFTVQSDDIEFEFEEPYGGIPADTAVAKNPIFPPVLAQTTERELDENFEANLAQDRRARRASNAEALFEARAYEAAPERETELLASLAEDRATQRRENAASLAREREAASQASNLAAIAQEDERIQEARSLAELEASRPRAPVVTAPSPAREEQAELTPAQTSSRSPITLSGDVGLSSLSERRSSTVTTQSSLDASSAAIRQLPSTPPPPAPAVPDQPIAPLPPPLSAEEYRKQQDSLVAQPAP